MGVDLMKDEVIVCNLNRNEVIFQNLEGEVNLTINKTKSGELKCPSNATILLDGRIIICDQIGVHVYHGDGDYEKQLQFPDNLDRISVYGLLPVRADNGMLGIFIQTRDKKYKMLYFDRNRLQKRFF